MLKKNKAYRIFFSLGVLESLDRDQCKELIEKYGGRLTGSISRKTNFLLLGRDGGESKIEKARELKVSVISEDDLLHMIETRPGDEKTPKKEPLSASQILPPPSPVKQKNKTSLTSSHEIEKAKTSLSTNSVKIESSSQNEKLITDESLLMCKFDYFLFSID